MFKPSVVLIAPSVKESLRYGVSDGINMTMSLNFGTYPPLGLCYLAGKLLQEGITVHIIDVDAEGLSSEGVIEKTVSLKPGIIGISSMSFTFLYALALAKSLKCKLDVPVVIGGNHVSLYPAEVLSHGCFDIGVVGEGEQTFFEVVRAINIDTLHNLGERLHNIRGLVFRGGDNRVIQTQPREFIANLDELPYPAVELLNIKRYCGCNLKNPYMTMMTSRGCPFKCYFCSKAPWGDTHRYHSAERVVSEVERLINEFGIRSIDFFDDTFTIDRGRVLKIAKLIKQRGLHFDFGVMTRADLVDKEIVASLKDAGCKIMAIGVESGSQKILGKLNKNLGLDKIRDAFRWANKKGIRTVGFFMIGNPAETMDEINETLRFIRQINADWFKANILIPYPGSRLYRSMLENGELREDYWRKLTLEAIPKPPPLANKTIDSRKLRKVRNYIQLMPYLRLKSNVFKLSKIKSFDDIKRSLCNMAASVIGIGNN